MCTSSAPSAQPIRGSVTLVLHASLEVWNRRHHFDPSADCQTHSWLAVTLQSSPTIGFSKLETDLWKHGLRPHSLLVLSIYRIPLARPPKAQDTPLFTSVEVPRLPCTAHLQTLYFCISICIQSEKDIFEEPDTKSVAFISDETRLNQEAAIIKVEQLTHSTASPPTSVCA